MAKAVPEEADDSLLILSFLCSVGFAVTGSRNYQSCLGWRARAKLRSLFAGGTT